jgi:hypothetical protein
MAMEQRPGDDRKLRELRSPELVVFSSQELLLIDVVVAQFERYTAAQIIELSPPVLGWPAIDLNATIPLGGALFSDRRLTEDERAYARNLAHLVELQGVIPTESVA